MQRLALFLAETRPERVLGPTTSRPASAKKTFGGLVADRYRYDRLEEAVSAVALR